MKFFFNNVILELYFYVPNKLLSLSLPLSLPYSCEIKHKRTEHKIFFITKKQQRNTCLFQGVAPQLIERTVCESILFVYLDPAQNTSSS